MTFENVLNLTGLDLLKFKNYNWYRNRTLNKSEILKVFEEYKNNLV